MWACVHRRPRIALQLKAGMSKKKEQTEFSRFKNLLRGVVNVPKKEVEIEETRWRAARLKKKKPAT
jgi:hypothetical protein